MTVPYRTHKWGNALHPVHRIKHVFDVQLGLLLGAPNTQEIIVTKDAPVLANTNEVETGSKVNGIYLKVEAYARTDAALANFYMMVMKNVGGNLTFPNANVVGSNDNKRFVIHQEMVMLQRAINGNPRTIFNGVIVIPRGYRRFAPDDRLQVQVFTPGVDADVCMQSHYKEFR